MPAIPIRRLRNIGPTSAEWLAAVGIKTRGDLEAVGAVMAYKMVKHHVPGASLNLLYSLEAALRGIHWQALPPADKERLITAAEAPLDVHPPKH